MVVGCIAGLLVGCCRQLDPDNEAEDTGAGDEVPDVLNEYLGAGQEVQGIWVP
jgi:hypothetical protein